VCAGFIELNGEKDFDPNVFFGIYAGLIIILLIASIFLEKGHEPEIILR